jgi:hypothetical protein
MTGVPLEQFATGEFEGQLPVAPEFADKFDQVLIPDTAVPTSSTAKSVEEC